MNSLGLIVYQYFYKNRYIKRIKLRLYYQLISISK